MTDGEIILNLRPYLTPFLHWTDPVDTQRTSHGLKLFENKKNLNSNSNGNSFQTVYRAENFITCCTNRHPKVETIQVVADDASSSVTVLHALTYLADV